jgi:hypothetical protein
MCMEQWWNDNQQGKLEELGGKPVQGPHRPPRNSAEVTQDWTRVSAMRSRRLDVWATALLLESQRFAYVYLYYAIFLIHYVTGWIYHYTAVSTTIPIAPSPLLRAGKLRTKTVVPPCNSPENIWSPYIPQHGLHNTEVAQDRVQWQAWTMFKSQIHVCLILLVFH